MRLEEIISLSFKIEFFEISWLTKEYTEIEITCDKISVHLPICEIYLYLLGHKKTMTWVVLSTRTGVVSLPCSKVSNRFRVPKNGVTLTSKCDIAHTRKKCFTIRH